MIIIDLDKQGQNGTTIFNILDNTTELWMTKYIIGEIFSSGRATWYKNPSDQTVPDRVLPRLNILIFPYSQRIWTQQRGSLKMVFANNQMSQFGSWSNFHKTIFISLCDFLSGSRMGWISCSSFLYGTPLGVSRSVSVYLPIIISLYLGFSLVYLRL